MPKITRKHQKILGSNSANNGQLGSARDGSFVLSDDPDVIQALSAWDDGLLVATLTGERLPTVEEIQGVYYVLTRQVAYLMQEGVAEYSADATYYENSIVKESGTVNLYRSLTDDNTGNALSDGGNWEFIIDLSSPNPLNNFTAVVDPTVNDDEGEGYSAGSIWRNGDVLFICVDATEGAAVWIATSNAADGSITLTKLADMPANTILGNPTGDVGGAQAMDAATARTNLGLGTAAQAPLVDDDTFATALPTNVPSAESVKAYVAGGETPQDQRVQAWVRFDGVTGTIVDSYNVSSLIVNSTANYTINFTNDFSNANYAAVGAANISLTGAGDGRMINFYNKSTSSISAYTSTGGGTSRTALPDCDIVIFGGQA